MAKHLRPERDSRKDVEAVAKSALESSAIYKVGGITFRIELDNANDLAKISQSALKDIGQTVAELLEIGVTSNGNLDVLHGIAEGAREAAELSGPRGAPLTQDQRDYITGGDPALVARLQAAQERVDDGEFEAGIQKLAARTTAAALTTAEAAEFLGIDASRVRHRHKEGTLYGFKVGGNLRFSNWQFDEELVQRVIPGVPQIVEAISSSMHPASVAGLMTTPQRSLLIQGEPVTPVEWLVGGGDVKAVTDIVEGYRSW